MMKTPTELQTTRLLSHVVAGYDPVKAHEYYIRTRELKGRKKGAGPEMVSKSGKATLLPGKTRAQISKEAKAKQRKELTAAINKMTARLHKLDALIVKRMHEEASENRKSKAKKERAAKDRDKPKTAAEKADAARENQKYRDKHKQELKSDRKKESSSSGGNSKSKSDSKSKKSSVDELKSLATRVRGQLAVAKQKLAAL